MLKLRHKYIGKGIFMKKIIILAIITISIVIGCVVQASADFGDAADVLASDVKVVRTALRGQTVVFSDSDVKCALVLSRFDSITVTKLPSEESGRLLLSGKQIAENTKIKRKSIPALAFIPSSAGVDEASFKFTVDGYLGGAEIECIIRFTDKVNYAPEVDLPTLAMTVTTYENVDHHGRLEGVDPEGDKLEYMVISYPKSGLLSFDKLSGKYIYSPSSSYIGQDKFTYVIRDEYGNYSEPVTVKIKVDERMCEVDFEDMKGKREYGASLAMTAMGIMSGRVVGDGVYFEPDTEVTRAEFLAMAMKAVGIKADSTIEKSFFDDDSEIPPALKPYVATAQRIGIAKGDFVDGELLFNPNEKITKYDAALIMSSLVRDDTDEEESVFAEDDETPIYARSSVSAMYSLGIFERSEEGDTREAVTRADAAYYLYKLINR